MALAHGESSCEVSVNRHRNATCTHTSPQKTERQRAIIRATRILGALFTVADNQHSTTINMDDYSVELDEETGSHCTLHLFTDVANASEIRERLVAGKLRCCVARASLVTDALQAVVAANKAALNAKRNRLVTRTLYTEVLFHLSISKNISRSLTEFGIHDSDKNMLVILIHKLGEEQAMLEEVLGSVRGERIPVSRLQEFTDVNLVKKTYKIDEDELQVSSLADAVISRISCKEFM